jgi:hydroxymethylglutaryl-CoA lyase
MGADEVMIADTVGYANPIQVERIFAEVLRRLPNLPVAAHFHDTRGLGLANVAAAARVGVRRFDASLGGLGGCPHAPGATGNVDFEDAAFLLETMGLATGIDFAKLIQLRRKIETWLPEERFAGAIARAGLPKTFRSSRGETRAVA